ncbi:quinoprotein dehydrogenase-associated SoxYZ-like carrier [Roseateles sp. BYS180W]|uniref:Quinoprotein dehydrogenase-associated SoxYZ-like carrier n=1 Tax=Roseateles rivi TaxID=3299028 RepID=A0ABW7FX99_9BURK
MAPTSQRRQALQGLGLLLLAPQGWATNPPPRPAPPPNPEHSARWQGIRRSLFGDQALLEPGSALQLDMPARAVDAAQVPLRLQAQPLPQAGEVQALWLVIDENPSPLSMALTLHGPALAFVQTRVRVDSYTHVRAIARWRDGSLRMATHYIKAAGGCAAPPLPAQGARALGDIELQVQSPAEGVQELQARIEHPNHNGLALDPLTRLATPAHFLSELKLSLDEQPLLQAQLDFSISDPPTLSLRWRGAAQGQLRLHATDNRDQHFQQTLQLCAVPR